MLEIVTLSGINAPRDIPPNNALIPSGTRRVPRPKGLNELAISAALTSRAGTVTTVRVAGEGGRDAIVPDRKTSPDIPGGGGAAATRTADGFGGGTTDGVNDNVSGEVGPPIAAPKGVGEVPG
jgi:hypothetical protein